MTQVLERSAPPAGQELRAVLDLVSPVLRRSSSDLWRPEGLRERYAAYLVAMHGVLRASVPLMEFALARCRAAAPDDHVMRTLGDYFTQHIESERGHDEWLLRDIRAVGPRPERDAAAMPSAEVARLVGVQYYWIAHHHPTALLGYIAALEYNAPAPDLARLLAERSGLPAAAFETLRLHALLDAEHSAAVLDLLDALDLGPALRTGVRISALHTVLTLTTLFDDLPAPGGGEGA